MMVGKALVQFRVTLFGPPATHSRTTVGLDPVQGETMVGVAAVQVEVGAPLTHSMIVG